MDKPFEPPLGNEYIPALDPDVGQTTPKSIKDDLSAREVALYTVLGVLFGALLAGGFAVYDPHPSLALFLIIIGAVGLILMATLLIWYRLKIIHALITTMAALVATWAVLAYALWAKPKEVIVHDPPTAEDIEKATAPIEAERDAAIKERDTARQELDAARRSVIPPPVVSPPTPQLEWSGAEIAVRSDLWRSIQNAMNSTVRAYNFGDEVVNRWEEIIPQDKNDYLARLAEFRKRLSDAADEIQKLRRDYPNFQDVSTTIDQPYLGPLLDSVDNFSQAISALQGPLPPNYETTLRPLAGAVRVQMNNFLDWISNVQSTSGTKLNQLQIMIHK